MSLILSFKEMAIGYHDTVIAQGISGELNSGQVLQITGANGSGKTTLVKTLLGEIPPVSGEISKVCSRFYYLKQNYQELIHLPLTVSEILNGRISEINFDSNLKWNDLSGGQKQQTLILRAFSQSVDMIVLDEPLNHLDANSIEVVTKLINKKLLENNQLAVVIVSHIPIVLDYPVTEVVL